MNPNHDPKTGEFSSGPGGVGSHVNGAAHGEQRTLGTKVLHGARIAAKAVAIGALAVGAAALAHGAARRYSTSYDGLSEDIGKVRNMANLASGLGRMEAASRASAEARMAELDRMIAHRKITGPKLPRVSQLRVRT